ncbi:MAG: ribonucleoside-diphosphate reductase subunit alpha, partial [Betaproteobacteria bacterium]|nr:ribonucleoside-diphosphate reductase subunit alpha [Betaproteobacteria bacterium]
MPTLQLAASSSVQNVGFEVIRRNGAIVPFHAEKISAAMTKAFLAVSGQQGVASAKTRDLVRRLTDTVVAALTRRLPAGGTVHIEDIQDQVELALMRSGEHDVARAYVLYREKRAAERANETQASERSPGNATIHVIVHGKRLPLDTKWLQAACHEACEGLAGVDSEAIVTLALQNLYDGVEAYAVHQALVLAARTLIEQDPDYSKAAARLLLRIIRAEVLGQDVVQAGMAARYPEALALLVEQGIEAGLLDPRLKDYDLEKLGQALVPERDTQFDYLGLQTLYDRYFLHRDERRIELPQTFFMRVAMGLSLHEINREERAIEFYNLLSSFDFMSS